MNNVSAGEEIQIEIRLNGTSARVESERRHRGDDDDDEDDEDDDGNKDEAGEVEGSVSSLTGTCPALTFAVGARVVKTTSATVFSDPCQSIRNGVQVEAKGSRAADGTFTATRVEIDDD